MYSSTRQGWIETITGVMFSGKSEELLRRVPELEVSGEPDYLQSNFIHGIKHMQCRFTPGRRAA